LFGLREQLFKLWGDLEEKKSAISGKSSANVEATSPSLCETDELSDIPRRKAGDQPDLDDSSQENTRRSSTKTKPSAKVKSILMERDLNISTSINQAGRQKSNGDLAINNKAFTCCIRQYGVKVPEKDSSKANAGDGLRWERRFGLFGTMIL
jgi:protection-of-telomeres protein 1